MSITQWAPSERPREKLIERGPQSLSDAELLAIFLRTGVPGKSAVDIARDLLTQFGSLRALIAAEVNDFCAAPGLGSAKYAQLQASLEISRRSLEQGLSRECTFNNSEATHRYLRAKLAHQSQEVFAVMFLDNRNRLIRFEELFFGTINTAVVYPREIVRKVIEYQACATILVHNHPSGDPNPSQSDLQLTEFLIEALGLIDVKVLDHVIVADNQTISLRQQNVLEFGESS